MERGQVKEGHRTFTSYQPPEFMRRIFSEASLAVIEHVEGEGDGEFGQDLWMARKL